MRSIAKKRTHQNGQKSKKVCLNCEKRRGILIECRECGEMGCIHLMSNLIRPDSYSFHVAGSSRGSTGLCHSNKCRDAADKRFRDVSREKRLSRQLRGGEEIKWIRSASSDSGIFHLAERRERRGVKGTLFNYYWTPACGVSLGGAWGTSVFNEDAHPERTERICKRCEKKR